MRLGAGQPGRARCCALHLDLHDCSLDAHDIAPDPVRCRWPQRGAGPDAVDGPVPRARDRLAQYLALGQRTAAVRARVVDGGEAPLEIEEGELLARHLDTLRLAGARSVVLATLMNCAMLNSSRRPGGPSVLALQVELVVNAPHARRRLGGFEDRLLLLRGIHRATQRDDSILSDDLDVVGTRGERLVPLHGFLDVVRDGRIPHAGPLIHRGGWGLTD